MSTTASRALRLLSSLHADHRRNARELAAELGVSERTVRRDVQTLRELGYPIDSGAGPHATYRLGTGGRLPPLLIDAEQAVAISLALQTSPTSILGLRDATDRALGSLAQIMDASLTAQVEATRITFIANYWDFSAPPLDPSLLATVGDAMRRRQPLRIEVLGPGGRRPHPRDPDFTPPRTVEPHHVALWAGRWYLVAYEPAASAWKVLRIDRLHITTAGGRPVPPRELPAASVRDLIMDEPDRGDTPAAWQCTGQATLALPAHLVARFAPGGSVVEAITPESTRLTVGAWSWAGVAGILATFDCALDDVEPVELRAAFADLADRASLVGSPSASTDPTTSP